MSVICKNCGTRFNSPFCPNCGAPANIPSPVPPPKPLPPPIPQMPQRCPDPPRPLPPPLPQISHDSPDPQGQYVPIGQGLIHKKHGCLFWGAIIGGPLILFLLLFSLGVTSCVNFLNNIPEEPLEASSSGTSQKGEEAVITITPTAVPTVAPTPSPVPTPIPTPTPEETFIDTMTDISGLKDETVTNLYVLLTTDLGFSKVSFQGRRDIGDIVYDVTADDYSLTVILDDDGIYDVYCNGLTLYADFEVRIDKQGLLNRVLEDSVAYYFIAQEIVKANLKSPKSADFPSQVWSPEEIKMQRNGDYVAVQSYVDAENSFGALIRSNFLVEFQVIDIDTLYYNVVYIEIDGTSSGEFIELN